MTANAVTSRALFGETIEETLRDSLTAAITTGNAKKSWTMPFTGFIIDVICRIGTAGSGGTSDIIDVNKNDTTIYTTQANRPTSLVGDTGMFSEAAEPEITEFVAGDII